MILLGNIFAEFNTDQFEIKVPSSEISFSLIDSIHTLYSRATMTVNDRNGLYSEYLLSTVGNVLNIKFGHTDFIDDILNNNYVLSQEIMEDSNENPDRLSGPIDISFIHEWYNKQEIKSVSYQDNIKTIVQDFVEDYPFSDIKIDTISNTDTFYQALQTQGEMITKEFLPISYSTMANKTPFFAFINSKNEFKYINYNTMYGGNTADDEYILQRNEVKYNNKAILDIKRWSDTLPNSKEFNKNVYTLGSDSCVEEIYLDVKDYYPIPPAYDYVLANNRDLLPTNYEFMYYGDASTDKVKGIKIDYMRKSLFKDRLMILVSFNPKLIAGKTVYLNFPLPNDSNETFSERFSGKYLIELSEHTWDGQSATAVSKFIVSRKYAKIPPTYTLKELL